MNFKTRIKSLREKENFSPSEIATALNISIQAYYKYESGKSEPSIENLIKLANILNVTLDYLVGRDFANDVGYLTTEQHEFVKTFLQLDDLNQAKVVGYVMALMR